MLSHDVSQLPSDSIHGEIIVLIVFVYSVLAADPLAPAQPSDFALLDVSLYACT